MSDGRRGCYEIRCWVQRPRQTRHGRGFEASNATQCPSNVESVLPKVVWITISNSYYDYSCLGLVQPYTEELLFLSAAPCAFQMDLCRNSDNVANDDDSSCPSLCPIGLAPPCTALSCIWQPPPLPCSSPAHLTHPCIQFHCLVPEERPKAFLACSKGGHHVVNPLVSLYLCYNWRWNTQF